MDTSAIKMGSPKENADEIYRQLNEYVTSIEGGLWDMYAACAELSSVCRGATAAVGEKDQERIRIKVQSYQAGIQVVRTAWELLTAAMPEDYIFKSQYGNVEAFWEDDIDAHEHRSNGMVDLNGRLKTATGATETQQLVAEVVRARLRVLFKRARETMSAYQALQGDLFALCAGQHCGQGGDTSIEETRCSMLENSPSIDVKTATETAVLLHFLQDEAANTTVNAQSLSDRGETVIFGVDEASLGDLTGVLSLLEELATTQSRDSTEGRQ